MLSVGIVATGVQSGRFRHREQVFVHIYCCVTCVLWSQRVIFSLLETVDFQSCIPILLCDIKFRHIYIQLFYFGVLVYSPIFSPGVISLFSSFFYSAVLHICLQV